MLLLTVISNTGAESCLLRGVALVKTSGVDLQHIGRSECQAEASEAGDTGGMIHEEDIVTNPGVAISPDRDAVILDGDGGVGDRAGSGH